MGQEGMTEEAVEEEERGHVDESLIIPQTETYITLLIMIQLDLFSG